MEGDHACSPDGKSLFECRGQRWITVERCLGADGCTGRDAQTVRCDNSTSEEGAPCQAEGTYACTPDHKRELVCRSGKLVERAQCRGPHGCRKHESKIECNQRIAEAGEACELEGALACTPDKRAELVCRGGKLVKARDCREACNVILDRIVCN